MLGSKLWCALLVTVALTSSRSAHALPQFARKYKMDCSGCHDALAFPRLNDVGYKFRRAGFRMPETIGQDELADYTINNYFSASVEVDNNTTLTSQIGSTDQLNTFSGELSLYALTGSFAKYFASQTELTFTPETGVDIENAYMRAVYGDQDTWVSARAGIMHPLEGLGGDDRSIGATRPLILEVPPFDNQDTLLTAPEPSRIGIDVGVQWEDTSISFEAFNRARAEVEGGEIVPSALGPDTRSAKDYMVVANQILGTRSSVSAYWMHGSIALPRDPEMFKAGTSEETFEDRFDRFAVFVSGGSATLLGLAGAQVGFDHALDPTSGTTSRFTSIGGFAEANFGVTPHVVSFLRFDYFDPSDNASNGQILRGTLGVLAWDPFISIVPELSVERTGDITEAGLLVHARVNY